MIREETYFEKQVAQLTIHHSEHTAHWEVGRLPHTYAHIQFRMHREKPWLDIDTHERGKKSSKRTMVTLTIEEARALYDWMGKVLNNGEA